MLIISCVGVNRNNLTWSCCTVSLVSIMLLGVLPYSSILKVSVTASTISWVDILSAGLLSCWWPTVAWSLFLVGLQMQQGCKVHPNGFCGVVQHMLQLYDVITIIVGPVDHTSEPCAKCTVIHNNNNIYCSWSQWYVLRPSRWSSISCAVEHTRSRVVDLFSDFSTAIE